MGGLALFIALLMTAMLTYAALSSFAPGLFATATTTPTVTNTFTPTPSRTPTNTSTSTPTSTKTSTPMPTPTSTPSQLTITGRVIANCHTGPSITYEVYSNLFPGQTVKVFARNALSTWFLTENPKSGFRSQCWISIGPQVELSGDPSGVPIVWDWPSPGGENTSGKPADNGGIPYSKLSQYLNRDIYCKLPHTCPINYGWSSNACQCVSTIPK